MKQLMWAGAILLGVTGCQTETTSAVSSEPETPTVNVLELEVGTCLNDVDQPLAQDLVDVPAVECSTPHQSEVFADLVVDGSDYPGIDALTEQAVQGCQAEFQRFVGVEFAASELNFHYYYPTQSSWSVGDRSIYCVVFDPGATTVGTLRGVER